MMKKILLPITIFVLLCLLQALSAQRSLKQTKQKTNHPKIISCGVCNSKAIYLPKPEYSKAARAIKASGAVNVSILIDEKGNVVSAKPTTGHPLLWAESVKAALKAKFERVFLGRKPVKFYGVIVYNFMPN